MKPVSLLSIFKVCANSTKYAPVLSLSRKLVDKKHPTFLGVSTSSLWAILFIILSMWYVTSNPQGLHTYLYKQLTQKLQLQIVLHQQYFNGIYVLFIIHLYDQKSAEKVLFFIYKHPTNTSKVGILYILYFESFMVT